MSRKTCCLKDRDLSNTEVLSDRNRSDTHTSVQSISKKTSPISIIDWLITALVSRSVEHCPTFHCGRNPPSFFRNKEVVDILGLEVYRLPVKKGKRNKPVQGSWEAKIRRPSAVSALYFTRSVLQALKETVDKVFFLPNGELLYIYFVSSNWEIKQFVKNAKYFTAYPFARYINQEEMPEVPDSYTDPEGKPLHPLIFKGKIRKILKNRLASLTIKNTHLFGTLLLGVKRACNEVPESFIAEAYEKHATILSTPPKGDGHHLLEFVSYIDRALHGVQPIKKYKLYEASTSACWERKRDEGGARETVRAFLLGDYFQGTFTELSSMYLGQDDRIHELREVNMNDIVERVYDQYKDQPYLNVMVHAITEPLKVRLITKGEALPYYLSIHFQKSMWSYLQDFPQFRPTGHPLEKDDLVHLAERMRKLEKRIGNLNFDKYVSGDYSAATDGVDIRMTMMIFDAFAKKFNLDDRLVEILRKVIGPQIIHYPEHDHINEEGEKVKVPYQKPFLQRNGQLMGSTLSFPILCIINIIAYWSAMEEYTGRRISLKELPVLVNGDDILFPANDFFYEFYWKVQIEKVGFKLSLGKNYISNKICTINSMCFHIKPNDDFMYVPFYNIGLLTGVSKHFGRTNDRIKPITDIYNQLVEGSFNKKQAHNDYIHYNREILMKYSHQGKFNIMLPWESGGLGFVNPEVDTKIKPLHRLFASYTREKMNEQLSRDGKITKLGLIEIAQSKQNLVSKKFVIPEIEFTTNKVIPEGYEKLKQFIDRYTQREILTTAYDYTVRPEFTVRVPKDFYGWKNRFTIRKSYTPSERRLARERADHYFKLMEGLELILDNLINSNIYEYTRDLLGSSKKSRMRNEQLMNVLLSSGYLSEKFLINKRKELLLNDVNKVIKRMNRLTSRYARDVKIANYDLDSSLKIHRRLSNDEILAGLGEIPIVKIPS